MEPETKLQCPISLCEIKIAGITCIGTIYDYGLISTWLKKHSTDPVTNLPLPSKFVFKKENMDQKDLLDFANKVKENTNMWSSGYKLSNESPRMYEKLLQLQENTKIKEWSIYADYKGDTISGTSDAFINACGNRDLDSNDVIKRPAKTGSRYQFVTIRDKFLADKHFKSELFDFAHLKDCTFYGCDLSRCRFIGTVFDGVLFWNCKFIGEQVNFYKSKIIGTLTFNNCEMEYVDNWNTTVEPENIRNILEQRMLKGKFDVFREEEIAEPNDDEEHAQSVSSEEDHPAPNHYSTDSSDSEVD